MRLSAERWPSAWVPSANRPPPWRRSPTTPVSTRARPEVTEALRAVLSDPDADVRAYARRALPA
ncbi:hypothetical protein ACFYY8_30235 [Streptosporangium sp. NPDC001559]|uniref:hypothetical protein n=1 Tax=unclassified Streptosporangium TaxID=2632669 RepID=UPI0036EC3DD5